MIGKPFSQLSPSQIDQLIIIVKDLHWLARRYADGRMTYATGLFNDHTNALLTMGIDLNPTGDGTIYAQDGMGRQFDKLNDTQAHLAAISAAEQRLATCMYVYVETNLDGDVDQLPSFLRDAYNVWKRTETGKTKNE